MNRKEMNPSGRPGRSYEEGNGNGCPVRKEVSWVTRVSHEGTRQDGNKKPLFLYWHSGHPCFTFNHPDWLKLAPDGVLFLDEVNATPPETKKAIQESWLAIHEHLHAQVAKYRR